MRVLKVIGIILLVLFIITTTLFTIYFLFGGEGYGIEALSELNQDGFFNGIKNFFVDIWHGIKFVFKA